MVVYFLVVVVSTNLQAQKYYLCAPFLVNAALKEGTLPVKVGLNWRLNL